jgi:integrase
MKITKVYRKDLGAHRWKIDITVDGQRIRRADFVKKQDAIDAVAALLSKARAVRYGLISSRPTITLQQLKDKIEKDPALKARKQARQIFTQFVNLIGSDKSLLNLSRSDWKKYVDFLREKDRKPGTINKYLAEVSSVLSSAPERFPDLEDWRPPKVPWLAYPSGRSRILSKEEISKILMALTAPKQHYEQYSSVQNRQEVFDLFRLMLLTGAREGEILNLRSSQVSWEWRTVRIESKKGGGSVRVVPLSDSAIEILKSRPEGKFFSITRDKLYRVLERVGLISGVAYGDNIDNGWVIYDLRHVAATVMENAGIPYSAVSAILGHKRRDQTATYAHAQMETLRRAVDTLEKHCREIDGAFREKSEFEVSRATPRRQA